MGGLLGGCTVLCKGMTEVSTLCTERRYCIEADGAITYSTLDLDYALSRTKTFRMLVNVQVESSGAGSALGSVNGRVSITVLDVKGLAMHARSGAHIRSTEVSSGYQTRLPPVPTPRFKRTTSC